MSIRAIAAGRFPKFALALALWACFGIQTRAQMPPSEYRLGSEDVLSIQVINFPELSVPQVTVPPDGKIAVPLLGSLSVSGKTTDEVAQALTTKWSDYVVSPSVTVSLTQKRHESVLVYGFVAHAQSVPYKSGMRLLQSLAQVGGVADDGDGARVTVTRRDGTKQTVDVADPQASSGTERDLALSPDDVVFVPARHAQVSVLGEVLKPGSYDCKEPMTVLDALSAAGGVTPETANLSRATILHNGQEGPLDLEGLLRQGHLDANARLSPGDRIFIPALFERIYITGAVTKPGYYNYKSGDRLLDALNSSNGPLQNADLKSVKVIHVNKVKNTATPQTVDLDKFLTGKSNGDMQANLALAPGDIVFVPEKGHKGGLQDLFSGLGALNIVSSTIKLLTGGL